MIVKMTQPYISVNVVEDKNGQSSPVLKFNSTTARRWWNRLSRLQKSVLLMTLSILIGFSFVLAVTWSPTGHSQTVTRFINNDAGRGGQHMNAHGQWPADHGRPPRQSTVSNGWKLPRDGESESELSTVKSLRPDYISTNNNRIKSDISKQRAENIRSVINLDPVIPLEQKSNSFKPLRFEGPQNGRQEAVVSAFLHAWKGYKEYAWGQDHLKPISGGGQDWFGLGLTLIDSLDTLYIMNLNKEFQEATAWVEKSLTFDVSKNVNLFETTIRVLGGLLSAYHMSGVEIFRTKAEELGKVLVVGFKSPSGIPYSDINLRSKTAHGPTWNPDSTTSEVSTIQLEFRDLSRVSGDSIYEVSAMNVSLHIHKLPKLSGLVPIHITPLTGNFRSTSPITLGARGDSYYEYLLKQWIQTGKNIDFLLADYLEAVNGMKNKLLQRTRVSNLTFLGELENNLFRPKMDHLVCYLPGTLALGVLHGLPAWHLDLAKDLLYTCYLTYKRQPTGLAPEITFFNMEETSSTDFFVKTNDAHNLLRPETIESLYYLHQITGDKKYQDWGWEIFQNFIKYTKVEHGFSSISNVLNVDNTRPRDMMESFFLGETLKYFYLLFSDENVFELDTWVFNTEAHLIPVREF